MPAYKSPTAVSPIAEGPAAAARRRRAAGDMIPEAPLVMAGGAVCRLRVWSEAEWAALPEAQRPAHRTYAAGLGWVAAIPVLHIHRGD